MALASTCVVSARSAMVRAVRNTRLAARAESPNPSTARPSRVLASGWFYVLVELGVRDFGVRAHAASMLKLAGADDALPQGCARGSRAGLLEVSPGLRGHVHVKIDAIEKRARHPLLIACDRRVVAATVPNTALVPAARTRVRCGDQLEMSRKDTRESRACETNRMPFQHRPQRFEGTAIELRKLVEPYPAGQIDGHAGGAEAFRVGLGCRDAVGLMGAFGGDADGA